MYTKASKAMDPVNLLILLVTFLAVTVICWGLVVIYCCLTQYYPCSSSSSINSSTEKLNAYQIDCHGLMSAESKARSYLQYHHPPPPQLEYLSPLNLINYIPNTVPYTSRASFPSLVYAGASGPGAALYGATAAPAPAVRKAGNIRRHASLYTVHPSSSYFHSQGLSIPPSIPPCATYQARVTTRAASVLPSSTFNLHHPPPGSSHHGHHPRLITMQPIYSCPTVENTGQFKSELTSATGAPPLPPMSKHPTVRKSRRLIQPAGDFGYI